MYAIIEVGGRQWKVEPGTRLDINRVATAVGAQLPVERVLLAHDGAQAHVGRPYVQGAKVICEVIEHRLGPKEISYHFRRRENWRKTVGHRQPLTRLVVKDILLSGGVKEPAAKAEVKVATPKVSTAKASGAKAKLPISPTTKTVTKPKTAKPHLAKP